MLQTGEANQMDLQNRVAWVTGGGKRLGRAVALELARRGCNLAIHYGSSAAEAHEVAKAAERLGRHALVYRADLARVDEIHSMGRRIEAEFGRLDILINCAANFDRVELEAIDEAAWDRALDVNLKGSAFCALEAARLMRLKRVSGENLLSVADGASGDDWVAAAGAVRREGQAPVASAASGGIPPINLDDPEEVLAALAGITMPDAEALQHAQRPGSEVEPLARADAEPAHRLWGKIINFADWSALRPYRNYLPYMVSKGGVVTLTEALAQELAPEITVNAIAPGTVLPPPHTLAEERARIERNIPLGRIGAPEDIVATVMYLLAGTDYVSGQVLCVDGGRYVAQPPRA